MRPWIKGLVRLGAILGEIVALDYRVRKLERQYEQMALFIERNRAHIRMLEAAEFGTHEQEEEHEDDVSGPPYG